MVTLVMTLFERKPVFGWDPDASALEETLADANGISLIADSIGMEERVVELGLEQSQEEVHYICVGNMQSLFFFHF